jgi:hypothetical protein
MVITFKLTDISYRLRFSFVSFACIVRSFFAFRSLALCSFVSCIVRFVRQFDYTNARNEIRTIFPVKLSESSRCVASKGYIIVN